MNAKDYLNQLRKIDCIIKNKMAEKEQWKSIAAGTSSQAAGERVQTSVNHQKMADAINRYVDIESEINEHIDSLIDKRLDIIETIEQLNSVEYDLLHKVYVQYLTLYDVAAMYDKTYSWATTIHGRALKNVQRILDECKE